MVEQRISALTYAIRVRVIIKYSGQLTLMLALLTLPPLFVALSTAHWTLALRYTAACALLFATGVLFTRVKAPAQIQVNEALAVTALTFLLSSLLMSFPLAEPGIFYIDALFESISGITTTGLSTIRSIESSSKVFLFTRSWMQWYGGLSIVVLSVAMLMGHEAAVRRLVQPVDTGETLVATARTHARNTLIVYVIITLLGIALLWLLTGDGFNALILVFSAVSTGGFSRFSNSLTGLNSSLTAAVVIAFTVMGAISPPLYWRAFRAGWRNAARIFFWDVELRAMLAAALLSSSLLILFGWIEHHQALWFASFTTAFSAQTTAGFSTTDISALSPASKLVLIVSMLTGGSVGSTAGGFKLLRALVLFRVLQLMLRGTAMPPHAVAEPYLGRQRLGHQDVIRALQLILLFVMLVIISWLPFLVAGYEPVDALFEVVSACGTVGLSSGIARPELETFLKGILCFDMLAGRVEIIALLALLYPRNWIAQKKES